MVAEQRGKRLEPLDHRPFLLASAPNCAPARPKSLRDGRKAAPHAYKAPWACCHLPGADCFGNLNRLQCLEANSARIARSSNLSGGLENWRDFGPRTQLAAGIDQIKGGLLGKIAFSLPKSDSPEHCSGYCSSSTARVTLEAAPFERALSELSF